MWTDPKYRDQKYIYVSFQELGYRISIDVINKSWVFFLFWQNIVFCSMGKEFSVQEV